MRVIKAVLFVAVLVCCLTSVFGCNPANSRQSDDLSGCICHSGYQGPTCDDLQITSCTSPTLSKTEATNFPSLSTASGATAFKSNTLFADIEAVYVYARQYEELKFTPLSGNSEAVACSIGNTGSYWSQNRTTACNDSFTLAMPWAHHQDCGFANNTAMSNADYMYITGYLHIKYTDWLGVVETFNLTRSTKVPYSITVKFQKHVTVLLRPLNVTSDVRFGMALTEDMYDPVSQQLTLQLTTIVNWPNAFYSGFTTDQNGAVTEGTHLYTPSQVVTMYQPSAGTGTCTVDNTQVPPVTTCPGGDSSNGAYTPLLTIPNILDNTCLAGTVDSVCKQSWTWVVMLDPTATGLTASGMNKTCSFDDDYTFNVTLYTCRDPRNTGFAPSCTSQTLPIVYTIQDSYVCGVLDITPAVSGQLYAFPSTVSSGFRALIGTSDITHFSLGTAGNFYAKIDSDGNDISVVFTNIRFKDQSNGAQWTNLFDVPSSGSVFQSQYINVYNHAKYFNIYFHSSTFKVNPNSQTVYTFSATVTITFSGNPGYDTLTTENKKRTVEMQWEQSTAQATTNVFMRGETIAASEVPASNAGVSSVTFIASVVGAVAGTMIIVFVVVGLALRARSTKEDGMSASLMAASAAASEVANRA